MRRWLLYALRWQASGLILAPVILWVRDPAWSAVLGNLIGAAVFWWLDRLIFRGGRTL